MADLPLHAGTWKLDPSHTDVSFSVRHLGVSKVRGHFTGVDGSLTVGDDLATTSLEVTVDLATVETGNADRDAHLRSSDFFNVETHPTMTYRSTSVRQSGDLYAVDGELTLNGITKPLTLEVEFNGVVKNPLTQVQQAGFSAKGKLNRRDFRIEWNMPLDTGGMLVGENVDISIEAEFVES